MSTTLEAGPFNATSVGAPLSVVWCNDLGGYWRVERLGKAEVFINGVRDPLFFIMRWACYKWHLGKWCGFASGINYEEDADEQEVSQ